MVHGVTLRAIGAFADADLDFRPMPGMRTPRELIFHIYAQESGLAEAAERGEFTLEAAKRSIPEDPSATATLSTLVGVREALAYAESCHARAETIFDSMSDDEIARPVVSPFGTYPSWQYFLFAYDEHWHHRGQLCVYLRLLGKTPPELYGY